MRTVGTKYRWVRRAAAGLVASAGCLSVGVAWGQDAPSVVVGGARPLALAPADDGVLVNVCAKGATCDAKGGQRLRPPASFRGDAAKVAVQVLRLDGGKEIGWVSFPGDEGRAFNVLVAAPKSGDAPAVLYSGVTGPGTERSTTFSVDQSPKGTAKVSITTRARLCGTEVLVSTRTLDERRLELVTTAGPDPLGGRRAGSVKMTVSSANEKVASHRLLKPRSSSSGRAALAVDGDEATAWVEEEPGAGRHAFVSFGSPAAIGITGLTLSLEAPADLAGARPPSAVTVVTDSSTYAVALGDKKASGTRYSLTFPSSIKTSCVALVVDEVGPAPKAGGTKGEGKVDPSAFVAELTVRTELDAKSLDDLAKGLSGGGAAPRDHLALLEAAGKRGLEATIAAYPALDGPGRDLARRLVDAAPCADKLVLYVPLLVGKDRDEADRARDRVRRCGKDAGGPLLAALDRETGEARGVLAEEAALLAPDQAVPRLILGLDAAKSSAERRPFRRALGKALTREVGVRAVGRAISRPEFAQLSLAARVDVLRALGDDAGRVEGASAALAKTASESKAFRERYLLLGPAAALARSGDASATAIVAAAIADRGDARLRARGAEVAGGIAPLRAKLLESIDDSEVRVREAALASLSKKGSLDGEATVKVLVRLVKDPWTFVRRSAAAALVGAPKGGATDGSIAGAVDFEPSPLVRAEMMKTLGARRASGAVPVVAERAFDAKEAADVRVRAIEALGDICAKDQLEPLSELALRGQAPVFEADRKLAVASITALGRLRPADLAQRLSPLTAEGAPAEIREVTRLVLADKTRACDGAGAK